MHNVLLKSTFYTLKDVLLVCFAAGCKVCDGHIHGLLAT